MNFIDKLIGKRKLKKDIESGKSCANCRHINEKMVYCQNAMCPSDINGYHAFEPLHYEGGFVDIFRNLPDIKTRITFHYINNTQIEILQDKKKIGEIWSQLPNGDLPYTDDGGYVERNGVQICGFNNISEVWNCGKFDKRKDVVIDFNNPKTNNIQE